MDNAAFFALLRCPLCKAQLTFAEDLLSCQKCRRAYPIVLGIPDLRVYEDPLIPLEDDYVKGAKIEGKASVLSFTDLVRYYWSLPTYPPTPDHLKERFIRHVLTDEERMSGYVRGLGSGRVLLDVGCGTAAFLKAASPDFKLAIGCDVAFRWLLIARKRMQEAGLPTNLVCCCADQLPFESGFADLVASVSLLEHVKDAEAVLNEFARVSSEPDGRIFTLTSNRFSLGPEPHVRVWGLGFLPRRWMPAFVKWRKGMAYEKKHLLSFFELKQICRKAGLSQLRFALPVIAEADWQRLGGLERIGAKAFEWARRVPLLDRCLLVVSPVIQLVAVRPSARVAANQLPLKTVGSIR